MGAGINATEKRKTKINKTENWLFGNIDKILAGMTIRGDTKQ